MESAPSPNSANSNSDREVEEILRKAQISINSSYDVLEDKDASSSPPAAAATKGVTFQGLPESAQSSVATDDELMLIKTQQLLEKMKETEIQLSGEKALRKKKDKNIMKLAKQLKRRNADYEEASERVNELTQLTKDLEQKLMLTQKELRQQEILHKRYTDESKKEYDRTLEDQQQKYSKLCKDHDERIGQLSKSHAQQCEELCREILKANLEADRLQSRINTIEGTTNERAMPLDTTFAKRRQQRKALPKKLSLLVVLAALVGIACMRITKEHVCAPARPGRIIKEGASMSFQAPWWAPDSVKDVAYQQLCSNTTTPTRLDWILDPSGFKVVLWENGKTTLSKRATSVEVTPAGLKLWTKRGYGEEVAHSWT